MRWWALLLIVTSACSFIGVRGPESRKMECTQSRTAPTVDTVVAVGAVVGTVAGVISASKNCEDEDGGEPRFCGAKLVYSFSFLIALPYSFSSWYGHTTVNRCRRYRSAT